MCCFKFLIVTYILLYDNLSFIYRLRKILYINLEKDFSLKGCAFLIKEIAIL